jgi:iron complex outermembrane recepter protein
MSWRTRRAGVALVSLLCGAAGAHAAEGGAADAGVDPQAASKLAHLSIEELGNIEITSVSKRTELLSDAAASIYVITADDIRRSGATSVPEILRLAPNLQVARVDASQYAITARGFNSTTANKLLVLIDGRSVYTPLYSGVFWDVQDIMPESIERIEVISGPGGTLWGANAVNGVINIISKHSKDTTGTLLVAGAGNTERNAALRQGGKIGEDGSYRLYAKGFSRDDTTRTNGTSAQDSWNKKQVGFRADWQRSGDTFMLEGSAYDGSSDQAVYPDKTFSGAHVIGRWNRSLGDRSSLEVQSYYDRTKRDYPGTFGEALDTWDIEVQHHFSWGTKHDIVWGGGYRLSRDDVTNSALLAFLPAQRNLVLANVFAQDTIAVADNLQLTLGGKLEHNSFTGMEFQPNARLAWKLPDQSLLWSALSRSVRTPSRIDAEFFAPGKPPFTFLVGNPDFQSEIQNTFEVGYRMQPKANASFSISAFYNTYDKLRSVEPGPPIMLVNKLKGNTYGIEMWGSYRVNDWWRLTAGYNYLNVDLRNEPDSRDVSSAKARLDPSHQFSLRSSMNLASSLEFDLGLRSIGELPNPGVPGYTTAVPGYTTVDARLGWRAAKDLEISLAGTNLAGPRHLEFVTSSTRSVVERSFYLGATWKF